MEILVWMLIIGVVIALTRLWSTACQESPSSTDAATVPHASTSYDTSGYHGDPNSAKSR
jgi:hypothetical protein